MNAIDNICTFETHELDSYSELHLQGTTEELLENYRILVKDHIEYCDANSLGTDKFFLMLAKTGSSSIAGYHFYTEGVGSTGCYLAAIYVVPEYRNAGLAYELACKTIIDSYQKGYRKFSMKFKDRDAFHKSLGAKLVQFAESHRDCNFTLSALHDSTYYIVLGKTTKHIYQNEDLFPRDN